MLAHRLHVAVKTRYETREALNHRRYMRLTLLVNLRRLASQAGKVDQFSHALYLTGATHLAFTSGKPLFELEPSL